MKPAKFLPVLLFLTLIFTLQGTGRTEGDSDTRLKTRIDSLVAVAINVEDSSQDLAFKAAVEASHLTLGMNYYSADARIYMVTGNYYAWKKMYQHALKNYFIAYDLLDYIQDPKLAAILSAKIGQVFYYLKRYGKAAPYYRKSLQYAYQAKDTSQIIRVLLGKGYLYKDLKHFDSALVLINNAIYFARLIHDTLNEAYSYRYLGVTYGDMKDYNRAIYYFNKGISLQAQKGYYKEMGSMYTLIGHMYQVLGQQALAIDYNRIALEWRRKENQTDQVISSLFNLANMYLSRNLLDSAKTYLDQGIRLVDQTSIYYLQTYGYGLLTDYCKKTNDYKGALEAYGRYSVAFDSISINKYRQEISVLEANQMINEMERKYEALSTENQIQRLEIRYRNLTTLILFSGIVLAVGLGFFLYKRYRKSKRSREILEKLNTQLDKEIKERKETEALLRASEQSYRVLAENSMDSIIHLDERFNLVYCSPNSIKMYRYSVSEMEEHFSRFNMVHPDFREKLRKQYLDMIETHIPMVATYLSVRKDGTTFWAETLTNPIYDEASGRFRGSLSVVRDVTERIHYEESLAETAHQKEVLLREIHHRVKNNFAILVSLMNMQLATSENENLNQLINDLQLRVRTMSLVHELLYRSENLDYIPFNNYIRQLANIISSTNGGHNVEIRIEMEPCVLNIEIALPLGLIVNELLTNSFKYAFKGVEAGEIMISLMRDENADGHPNSRSWILTIRDNGVGLPEGFNLSSVNSLGSQIIRLLVEQIEGRINFYSNGGAVFVIRFQETP